MEAIQPVAGRVQLGFAGQTLLGAAGSRSSEHKCRGEQTLLKTIGWIRPRASNSSTISQQLRFIIDSEPDDLEQQLPNHCFTVLGLVNILQSETNQH